MDAFVGIDVAFAKKKRLPVALCVWEDDRLVPKAVAASGAPLPPRGSGNVAALDGTLVRQFANDVAAYLHGLEQYFNVVIRRVGIDAPSDPKSEELVRRRAEAALDARRISYFTTPSSTEFDAIQSKARLHLEGGGAASRLPHANQLWMLVGFALFARLRRDWECLEVFPQATAVALGAGHIHKHKPGGVRAQLAAAARHTKWPARVSDTPFRGLVWGPAHDGLDAYLAAWVAALSPSGRFALGGSPNDSIWLPTVDTAV